MPANKVTNVITKEYANVPQLFDALLLKLAFTNLDIVTSLLTIAAKTASVLIFVLLEFIM